MRLTLAPILTRLSDIRYLRVKISKLRKVLTRVTAREGNRSRPAQRSTLWILHHCVIMAFWGFLEFLVIFL